MNKGLWKKKDGTMVKIKDMEDVYLIRAIEMFKKELREMYPGENLGDYMLMEYGLPIKFFELQFEAYTRDILPAANLVLNPEMPEEYIPEGMKVELR